MSYFRELDEAARARGPVTEKERRKAALWAARQVLGPTATVADLIAAVCAAVVSTPARTPEAEERRAAAQRAAETVLAEALKSIGLLDDDQRRVRHPMNRSRYREADGSHYRPVPTAKRAR
jgi:hypothetical protein